MRALVCVILGLLSGCEQLLGIRDPAAAVPDGGLPDAGNRDGSSSIPSSPLLLSEVVLAPTEGEMIEIINTSSQDCELSTYYLSDSGNYYTVPAPTGLAVSTNDFIVKFPAGAVIAGHKAIVVAIDTSPHFEGVYGVAPSFSIADGSMQAIAMSGLPTLTNEGEPVVLFQWDGQNDLVRDIDIMLVGVPAGMANVFPNKSGVQQDGPDADAFASAYALDRRTIAPQPSAPVSGQSTKRIKLESGHEVQDGSGNGEAGNDETSEDTSVTWDTAFTAPTPFSIDVQP